jgi:hypothetical protein
VVTPLCDQSRMPAIFHMDGSGQLLTLTDESITLSHPATRRILVSVGRSQSGAQSLSYSAYDTGAAASVESTVGPDGKVDLRTTKAPGRPAITEFRLGERWPEYVKRGGQVGTMIDGEFMSISAAASKLGVKAAKPIANRTHDG